MLTREERKLTIIIISSISLLLVCWNSIFILDPRQKAVVFEFGRVVREVVDPGLCFKIPFIQSVAYYEKSLLNILVLLQFLLQHFRVSDSCFFWKSRGFLPHSHT